MEYREGRCPKCGEVMQIPVGRETIICMFCGKTFSQEAEKAAVHASYQEDLKKLKDRISSFFVNVEKTVKGFQRNAYQDSFAAYLEKYGDTLRLLADVMTNAAGAEEAQREVAALFIEHAKEALENEKGGRIGRESAQMTMNMYMVTYVLPSILAVSEKDLSGLADEICRQWAAAFKKSNIQAAPYETLQGGFKRKLCYVTTAVCESLQKPEDCYELRILKNYRDAYLASSQEGSELIAQYYDMAPTIVKRVNKCADKEEIYRMLYETYISPCVHLIEEAKNEECLKKYQEMVEMLKGRYL